MGGRGIVLAASSLASALAVAAGAAAKAPPPQLRVTAQSPVTVVGTHFRPRERVVVRVGETAALRRVVRATASGGFVVRFAISSDPCNGGLVVTARGAATEAVTAKLNGRTCAPAP
jgi:hypothetical protein